MRALIQTLLMLLLTAVVWAQDNPSAEPVVAVDNPVTAHNKFMYGALKQILLRSAETMPEENYKFKPVETVRSFGQIVGHVADSQYAFCSAVQGEKNPAPRVEKTQTSKADLIAALNDAFAYCDRAYAGVSDTSAGQMVKLGRDTPKLGALTVNLVHSTEHYGNLLTYMRMKNIVPPTSDPEFLKKLSAEERAGKK